MPATYCATPYVKHEKERAVTKMNETETYIPSGVKRAVRAMCEDYDRRAREIASGKLPPDVLGNYMILNATVDTALASCCEEQIRNEIRHDIGAGVGHRFTQVYYLSPNTYKERKHTAMLAMAKAMKLL